MEKKIKVAVVGCGVRALYVVDTLLKESKRMVEIVAIYDPSKESCDRVKAKWELKDGEYKIAQTYQEAINTEGVQWVMIFSPNVYHKEQILCAFDADKHVFTEKPLATSIEGCQEIYEAHNKKSHLIFATGFVLRYAPLYRKTKELLESGKVGRILSIEANENIAPAHGGYIMANWRRHTKIAGPHILEKCCHDLDLINWFCKSLPVKISAMGSREFFKPENYFLEEKYKPITFNSWANYFDKVDTPFNDDNDLMDVFAGITRYRNGIYVSFNATMSNAIPERRMRFNCTEGSIIIELYKGVISYKQLAEEATHIIEITGDGHGGGDNFIMQELYDSMCNGTLPKCSANEGLESAVFALAFDKAAREEKVVDLTDTWKKLNR